MFRRISLTFVLMPFFSAHASSFTYKVQEGQWTVNGGKSHCEAMNRPPSEANYAPINMMFIHQDEKREPKITVIFWPGALPEKATSLKFTLNVGGEQKVFDVPAKIGNPELNVIATTEPLPKDFSRTMGDLSQVLFNMDVEVPGSKARTVFSIEDISRVLNLLNSCVYELEQSKKAN